MKFIIDNIYLFVLILGSGISLLIPVLQKRGKKVTPMQAVLLINKDQASIVDVRDVAEFSAGHLRNAKNIPLAELRKRINQLGIDKTRPLVVVCQTGVRSARATALLLKAGFNAVSLDGGVAAWETANLPISKD